MADTIAVKCPKCSKAMKVPATLAGKKIRCKGCEAPVTVPAAKEAFKLAEEPKPVEPPKPKGRFDDDDDDPRVQYDAQADDHHIARCPFCAVELDPPDAVVCKNCGFNNMERRRHESKAVLENTIGDYLSHHAITIGAFLFILLLIALNVYCFMNMHEWFEGSFLEMDEKDPTTGKKKYYVNPGLATTWICVFSIGAGYYAGKFIYRMLAKNFHPTEQLSK